MEGLQERNDMSCLTGVNDEADEAESVLLCSGARQAGGRIDENSTASSPNSLIGIKATTLSHSSCFQHVGNPAGLIIPHRNSRSTFVTNLHYIGILQVLESN
jgi:hypothetical protein